MNIKVRSLGISNYQDTWEAMKNFVSSNPKNDEIWITEHYPIYTVGLNKKGINLPINKNIETINVDRGGKITYHGPGQLIIYTMINTKKNCITIRQLVTILEQSVIHLLNKLGVKSFAKKDAPGVYINNSKIASIGLRLKDGFTYHGLSLNINMDLGPFKSIDPCGLKNISMAQLSDFNKEYNLEKSAKNITKFIKKNLNNYNE
jgi:lipoyl(octanoyl) transferase